MANLENVTMVDENGEVITNSAELAPLSDAELQAYANSEVEAVTDESKSTIPPILIKGLMVAGGYAAYRLGRKGYGKIKEKIQKTKAEKESALTPEQRKVAEEAYLTLNKQGISDETILYEAGETAKLYAEENKQET